jgi:HEAT repeat protein
MNTDEHGLYRCAKTKNPKRRFSPHSKIAAPLYLWLLILLMVAGQAAAQDPKKDGGIQPEGLKNLRHPDANVRYRTAALLAKQGPLARFAIEELREALQDADPLVRLKVAEAIWKVERPAPSAILPTVQRALKDKSPEVRVAACAVIGVLGSKGKAAVPALIEALKDRELSVVIGAIGALGDIGPAARDSAPALLGLSGYADFFILEPMVGAALGEMGEAVVPALVAALKEPSPERRRVAAYALGSMGAQAEPAVKALGTALGDEQWPVRSLAARALGNVGKGAKTALRRLRHGTEDPEVQVRIRAALAVWQVGGETKYVPLLARSLKDEAPLARELACHALATIGGDAREAVPVLTTALEDKEPIVRQAAAEALGNIGPAARDSAATLRALLKDGDKALRLRSAFALWRVTGQAEETLAALQPLLAEDGTLQIQAVEKLGALGAAAVDLLPDLVTMYREQDGEALRTALAEAIKKIDPKLAGKLGIR